MLAKLRILAYSDEDLRSKIGEYEVQINPESYSHNFKTTFSEDRGIDTAAVIAKFKTHNPQDVKFDFFIDSTGVVPGVDNVADEITKFRDLAYTYNGQIHSPNYLQLVWGDMVFNCLLASLDVDYQMFNPSGTPLRAKLTASFRQHTTPEELAKRSNKKSADLSHSRTVVAGTTLPLMTSEVYRDSALYIQVARANDMNDVMHLVEGTELRFPPVED